MIWNVLVTLSWLAVLRPVTGQSNDYLQSSFATSRDHWSDYAGRRDYGLDANGGGGGWTGESPMDSFRLPTNLKPVSYHLEVDTDFNNLTYAGRVRIVVRVPSGAPVCQVVLNAKELNVTSVRVFDQKMNTSLTVDNYCLVDRNEQLIVRLNKEEKCMISKRDYVVDVTFKAPLRNDMSGYYKSSYKENNVTKWLAVTQFEPTSARKAFPCFDEPGLKTPFHVSIKRRSDQISLSNMPILNSTKIQNTNMYWDHFQETPPISTYLIAFFVGEFYAMTTRTIRVYTHESFISQAKYVADESPKLLEAMENFTGVYYTLPKLDLLAIPDFSAGAMENWGLNTYRERLLLLPEESKTKTKEFVTTVVQHEFSHQWFGDLVTCAWWDYLWLNEGFATYFEYFATKMVKPDWRLEEVFVYEVHQEALEIDQVPMHPITGSVETPTQIKSMFDGISYSKAGAVLRMLQYTVTEKNFKDALNKYLTNNQYKAATPKELWEAFEYVLIDADFSLDENDTDISVTKFMRSWTEQAGYPLVQVARVNNTLIVTQERFLVNSVNDTNSTEWIIGLTYTTESEKNFTEVLPTDWLTKNMSVLSNCNKTGWYIFNLQSIGFYRVNYDEDNWNALISQLNNDCEAIHVLNRAQMIDDAFTLAKAKILEYSLVLRLSEYLKNENDVIPWHTAKNSFSFMMSRMRRCSHGHKSFKTYVGYLAGLIYTKTEDLIVNHNSTEHSIKTGWSAFSRWACELENELCIKSASSYFQKWSQGEKIPSDIMDAAFCVGVKNGDAKVWNRILNVYINSESASDRQSALLALACSKDPIQLSKYLDMMLEDGPIRPQDFRVIYQSLGATPEGISALTEFLTNKLNRIINEVVNGERIATSIYSTLASRVSLKEEIAKIDNLRKNSSVPEYLQKKFNSSYSAVDKNTVWFQSFHRQIGNWSTITIHELGLDKDEVTNSTTTSPSEVTTKFSQPTEITTSANKHQTSSGASRSNDARSFVFTLQIVSSILLVNYVLHLF